MKLKNLSVDTIIGLYSKKGYQLFEDGDYNINIFGIRSSDNTSNSFNDCVGLLYKKNNEWVLKVYNATTDPGLYYRLNPCNCQGTAILKEGYHSCGFKLGYHKGKYQALVQNKALPLYRDANRDEVLDHDCNCTKELTGINIHHASANGTSVNVDKWSAGCQVIASIDDWDEFIGIVVKSSKIYGSVFSYALFEEEDLND